MLEGSESGSDYDPEDPEKRATIYADHSL